MTGRFSENSPSHAVRLTDLDRPSLLDAADASAIVATLNRQAALEYRFAMLDETLQSRIDFIIAALLKKYRRENLRATLYTCLKEILVNATRANARVAWFQEQKLDLFDPEQYHAGMERLRGHWNRETIRKYAGLARDMNLEVQLHFFHNPRGLRIEVRSTALLTAEEHRIRRRLTAGMGYEDLVQFYRTHGDRSEGEGLGLAMVLLLYRAEGLNPHLFRIGVVDGETLARLEVPLSPNFVSVRGADPAGLIARG